MGFCRGPSGQSLRLYTSVDPVSAPNIPANDREKSGGAAGHCPRVRSAYYARVYRHSSLRNDLNIGAKGLSGKHPWEGGVPANFPEFGVEKIRRRRGYDPVIQKALS